MYLKPISLEKLTQNFYAHFIISLIITQFSFAQNGAPSLYLNYNDYEKGDIIINTLRVPNPSPLNTYYCGMLWNGGQHAGGYCGMQEHPAGRNFIFSLWDDELETGQRVTHDYAHPGTNVDPFGGEGTGLRSINYALPWNTGEWYVLVSRAWTTNPDSTLFGYWIYDETETEWHHLVTMNYPVGDVKFNTRTSSFLEDWLQTGYNNRTVHHKNGWKRRTSDKSWINFSSTGFSKVYPDARTANYSENYNGGTVDNEYFFMSSGGTISPVSATAGTTLYLPLPGSEPNYPEGTHNNYLLTVNEKNLNITWDVNTSKLPQYSYHIEVYDNDLLTGEPVLKVDSIRPHQRSHDFDITGLGDGVYYLKFNIVDIFDNESGAETKPFTKGSLVDLNAPKESPIKIYPNPFFNNLSIDLGESLTGATITLTGINGDVILDKNCSNISQLNIKAERIDPGVYFLNINSSQIQKTIKVVKR